MTQTQQINNSTTITNDTDGPTASAAATAYFAAERNLKALKATIAKEVAVEEASKKTALNMLSVMFPAKWTHKQAIHPITVDNNSTATFLHRHDNNTKWQKVAEGILPMLTVSQTNLYRALMDTWTNNPSPRTTCTLKK